MRYNLEHSHQSGAHDPYTVALAATGVLVSALLVSCSARTSGHGVAAKKSPASIETSGTPTVTVTPPAPVSSTPVTVETSGSTAASLEQSCVSLIVQPVGHTATTLTIDFYPTLANNPGTDELVEVLTEIGPDGTKTPLVATSDLSSQRVEFPASPGGSTKIEVDVYDFLNGPVPNFNDLLDGKFTTGGTLVYDCPQTIIQNAPAQN